MSAPNLAKLRQDLKDFDNGPLCYTAEECKALRKRCYHAMYYDDQGWQKMDMLDHVHLARMVVRLKSIERHYEKELEADRQLDILLDEA